MAEHAQLAEHAASACREYEIWASAIPRLTKAIGDCECPREIDPTHPDIPGIATGQPSCFRRAAAEEFPDPRPDHGPTRRDLDAIAREVADCPSCSRLCALIAERKQARKQFGAAKRRVRQVGCWSMAECAPLYGALGISQAERDAAILAEELDARADTLELAAHSGAKMPSYPGGIAQIGQRVRVLRREAARLRRGS